jgi:hypothetical protein
MHGCHCSYLLICQTHAARELLQHCRLIPLQQEPQLLLLLLPQVLPQLQQLSPPQPP